MNLDEVGVLFVLLGLTALGAALLPRLLSRAPVSMPMVFLGGGIALFAAVPTLPTPDPLRYGTVSTHLTEVCVIISLMGAGLAIDRSVSRAGWSSTWRLLGITMTLSVAAMAAAGVALLGLGVAAAILLAGALAPTDPVLASEVQVAEPAEDPEQPDEDEARFALTSEAGLNDGLAFPVTYLALGVAAAGALTWPVIGHWVAIDLGWRVTAGVAVGLVVGWLLRRLFFHTPVRSLRLAEHAEGFVALAATFLAYGFAEAVEGYGFLAVFVCACTIRAGERSHGYHRVLHSWVEQLERLLTVVLLLLLGGAIARGLLAPLRPVDVAVVAGFLLLVRPLAGWIGLIGGRTGPRERAVIAFFGVRGIGSLFYVAYALGHGSFAHADRLWAIAGLTVAGSVLLHGITATPAMILLDRTRDKVARARHGTTRNASDTAV
jgi:NhaP-type Na+/H+ or K+/H+ antiporter